MKNIDTIILDLDDTMYRYETGISYIMNGNVATHLCNNLNISYGSALSLQASNVIDYGTNTSAIIKGKKNIKLRDFLVDMHSVPFGLIPEDKELSCGIKNLKEEGKQVYIFSNAINQNYIPKVLDSLGVDLSLFDGISGIEDVGYHSKPTRGAYDVFIMRHGIEPKRSIMIEDSIPNLKTAKEYGMKTMLIAYPKSKHKDVDLNKNFIDYISYDINTGLNFIRGGSVNDLVRSRVRETGQFVR